MTDRGSINKHKAIVNQRINRYRNNVIQIGKFVARYGLFFKDPYDRALWNQIQTRHEQEKIAKAKKDTLFPTDLTDAQWLREIAMREGRFSDVEWDWRE